MQGEDRSSAAEAAFGTAGANLPCFAFESQPGDVLVFAVSTFHASFGGAAGRRQGVMVYYEDPQQPVATEAIVRQMQGNHTIFSRHRQQMYPKYWRELATKDARRGMWMARMAELGVLETPIPADDDQNAARL